MSSKKDQMYNWITKRDNPLGGECLHNCSYCYVKPMKVRFPKLMEKYSGEPRIEKSGFSKNLKKEDTVFICTCNDLFANNVPKDIIIEILKYYDKFDCTKLLQTKNPNRLSIFKEYISRKFIVCTTIEQDSYNNKFMGRSPDPYNRAIALYNLSLQKYVTIEPIMDFGLISMIKLIKMCSPIQVNIGADSGNNNLPEPPKEKILELITELEKFTTVKLKKNLNRLLK